MTTKQDKTKNHTINKKTSNNDFVEGTFAICSGQSTGFDIKGALLDAQKSIIIVSPYITLERKFILNALLYKIQNDVTVHIITSPELFTDGPSSFLQRLVKFFYYYIPPFFLLLNTKKMTFLSRKIKRWMFHKKISKNETYQNFIYSITTKALDISSQKIIYKIIPNLYITMSPRADLYKKEDNRKNDSKKALPPKLHSKIYIIDDKVAFTGSVNMTSPGFYSNHETCLKTTSPEMISYLKKKALQLESLYISYHKEHEHHNHLSRTILEKHAPYIHKKRKKSKHTKEDH